MYLLIIYSTKELAYMNHYCVVGSVVCKILNEKFCDGDVQK